MGLYGNILRCFSGLFLGKITVSMGCFLGKIFTGYHVFNTKYWLVVDLPPEKYEFVSWDDDITNIWKVIKFHGSSHHQPATILALYLI